MPKQPEFRHDMDVKLIRAMASDADVVEAAKVSTQGVDALDADVSPGFINFLMKNRHGSPFEHSVFKFFISAPIFVWREIMRHRIASYNEESGRYKQLEPVFYIPGHNRPFVQEGKPGHYIYVPGTQKQYIQLRTVHMQVALDAYRGYESLLEAGIAREVARMSLPLNIYSSAFVSMNSRALMNFLSLRTKDETSMFPSFPMGEIEMVARDMEYEFKQAMPITWKVWNDNGRVAP